MEFFQSEQYLDVQESYTEDNSFDKKAQMIQSFKNISHQQNSTRLSELTLKRQNFREERRKQYLNSYFEKKRVDFFGWRTNSSNVYNNEIYEGFQAKPQRQESFNQNHKLQIDLKPAYSSNYFNDVILLQKLISEKSQLDLSSYNSLQQNFQYTSFYSFLTCTIHQSLDASFLNQLDNKQLFTKHFLALKKILYNKLAQQVETFLKSVYQFNSSLENKNAWAYHNFLLDTYRKILYQVCNFIKSENLVWRGNNDDDMRIGVQEQLMFLVKMLIQVAYYDDCWEGGLGRESEEYGRVRERFSTVFGQEQQEDDPIRVEMTKILIQETQLLETLKFLIVFGTPNGTEQQDFQSEHSPRNEKSRQRILSLVMVLLRNIALNLGSDILFVQGIIAELKCILNEPYYKVNIRKPNINRKQTPSQRPILYYKIQSFIMDAFQLIREEQTQQYLSKIDSFRLVLDFLQEIDQTIKHNQISHNEPRQKSFLIDREMHLFEVDSDQLISLDEGGYDREIEIQTNHMFKESSLQALATQCIECLEYHFLLGQRRLRGHLISELSQLKKLSSSNPYVIKFAYIANGQEVLRQFQRGQQLLKMMNL